MRPDESGILGAEERVRPCLECGTILPFDAEVCSLCGEQYRVLSKRGGANAEAVKPCLACDAIIPERHLFCPNCGDFTLSVEVGTSFIPPIGSRTGRSLEFAVRALSFASVGVGLALLASAAYDFYRVLAVS